MLQAAGLRLLCRLWHSSGGRAYPQLRTAVIGRCTPAAGASANNPYRVPPCHRLPYPAAPLLAAAGYAAPGTEPGLPLRVARAECLRDICASDPDKAVELVGLLQVRWGL